MFQSEGAYKEYQVRLSKAREHAIFKGTYKEYQVRLSKAKERHMHWELKYGTLLMVPQAKLSYGCTR